MLSRSESHGYKLLCDEFSQTYEIVLAIMGQYERALQMNVGKDAAGGSHRFARITHRRGFDDTVCNSDGHVVGPLASFDHKA